MESSTPSGNGHGEQKLHGSLIEQQGWLSEAIEIVLSHIKHRRICAKGKNSLSSFDFLNGLVVVTFRPGRAASPRIKQPMKMGLITT
jgi:hypothetical protein